MKTCFKCLVAKPLSEFYPHSRMADGHLNKCRECTKVDVRRDRALKPNAREYDRARATTPKRKALRAKISQRWLAADPRRMRAHNAVHRATASGRLAKQPCEECGARTAQAHHDDYDKPLEVRWMCARCHIRHHHAKPF